MQLAELENAMARAVEAQDFETAAALRDRVAELRAEADPEERAFGRSFNPQRHVTPAGWTRPLR